MSEQDFGRCSCCGKDAALMHKTYYYSINCECCMGAKHFHRVKHCENCTPRPPEFIKISLEMQPDAE